MSPYTCPACGKRLRSLNTRCTCTGSTKSEPNRAVEGLRTLLMQQCIRCGMTVSTNQTAEQFIEFLGTTLKHSQESHIRRDKDDSEKDKLLATAQARLEAAERLIRELQEVEEDFEEALREEDPRQQIEDTDAAMTRGVAAREALYAWLASQPKEQP